MKRNTILLAAMASMTLGMSNVMAGLLVTEITGKAEIDDKNAVATLAEIPDGARLSLQEGASIVAVDLVSGKEYVFKGGRNYHIMPKGPQGSAGTVAATMLPSKGMPDIRIVPGMVVLAPPMRSLPKANVPRPISPVKTTVISDAPLFRWSAVEGANGYRLSILKQDGSLHWDSKTRETQLSLEKAHRLVPGDKYTWRIEYFADSGRTAEVSAEFSVAPAATIKQLSALKADASAPFSRRVLYAAVLTEVGAKEEAREIWKELVKEKPDDPVLRKFADAR